MTMTKSLCPSDLLHRHYHHHHHHHPSHSHQHHNHHYHHHSSTPKTTASITPSTIQCTQFYTSHHQHYHHHHRHHNNKSSKSFFFSSFTTSSSSTSALLSTAQLHRLFKAMKKTKSTVFLNSDRLIKNKPESTTATTPVITPSTSFSSDYHQPVLLKRSSWTEPCLDQWLANSLQSWLPPRIASSSRWNLLYSLEQHGCSIRTLYDKVKQHSLLGANLLVIRTADEEVIEQYYYGSGECFLWKSNHKDQLQVYPWTGVNDYMIFSNQDFIAIGGGDGQVGLFLHADLQTGHTQPCDTFDNDILTQQHYFEIIGLEIWGFDY
ncbi:TLD-domain-containing protein [Absidia repens]|uniref:Oxidation resistance protein 1 n=1 Tax=Absidia repens TaxID=90262 RepID=A0A1X2J091_9FUNG|nr:TLD-domain-containing protein [Absidia repens]